LILWGHGPELLLEPAEGTPTGTSYSMYVTPEELRKALDGRHIDIVGFDACFMSMLEMACELDGCAKYMVASQQEVPDASFPYYSLVELFRKNGSQLALLLQEENARKLRGGDIPEGLNAAKNSLGDAVQDYLTTYQDYIFSQSTGITPATLSVLDLGKCGDLKDKVKALADALVKVKDNPDLLCRLIQAREKSQDYASGLYVDLYEFCRNLVGQLRNLEKTDAIRRIQDACRGVLGALNISETGDSLILMNGSVNDSNAKNASRILFDSPNVRRSGKSPVTRNHGISIYLPYLTDTQYAQVQRPLVKGTPGSHSGKGFDDALNGAATEYLMSARRDLILETESYYPDLKLASATKWYDFITQVWTRALIEKVPADLDYHYSAQQSWTNVCREQIFGKKVLKV
jgi:hypothetical protein